MDAKFYSPGDDTFTFISLLQQDEQFIKTQKIKVILEVGCGSGEISKHLEKMHQDVIILSTDINEYALENTKNIMRNPNLSKTSLLNNIKQSLVDMIVFNPPYVETEEYKFDDIQAAYSGGKNGREVIDQFINQLQNVKLVYLLIIKNNNPNDVLMLFKKKNYHAEILKTRKILGETIYIIRAQLNK